MIDIKELSESDLKRSFKGVRIMYCMRVYYKDGTQGLFYFETPEQRAKSKEWHLKSLNVERVTTFELEDCL